METPGAGETARMTTAELRRNFLVADLFQPGRMNLVYTDLDRLVVGGICPESEIPLPAPRELGTRFFTERREVGIMNLGEPGTVLAGRKRYTLEHLDCLYIGMGEAEVVFEAPSGTRPAFYLASAPAHRAYPTRLLSRGQVQGNAMGDAAHANRRRIHKYIAPGIIESCQLVMGFTELEEGSVWNTMPPHTHCRRSEIYLYFDLGDGLVFHFMGTPDNTRHLVMREREVALSPSWSLHTGAGTKNYRFLWVMAGENQEFADIDPVAPGALA
jgi:4-deoxy-L-threo-5-hexosulose-uronate ketol-isomerase